MDNDTYNGWMNRETWALHLHVSNDEGLLGALVEHVNSVLDEDDARGRERRFVIADAIKEWAELWFDIDEFEEATGEPPSRALTRIAQEIGSLWRVDWDEITEAFDEQFVE